MYSLILRFWSHTSSKCSRTFLFTKAVSRLSTKGRYVNKNLIFHCQLILCRWGGGRLYQGLYSDCTWRVGTDEIAVRFGGIRMILNAAELTSPLHMRPYFHYAIHGHPGLYKMHKPGLGQSQRTEATPWRRLVSIGSFLACPEIDFEETLAL